MKTKKLFTEAGEPALVVDLSRCAEDIDAGLKKVLDFFGVADKPAAELASLTRPEFIKLLQGRSRREVVEVALGLHAQLATEPVPGARIPSRIPTKEERETRATAAFDRYNSLKPGAEKRAYLAKHGTQILAGAKLHEHSKK